MGPVEQIENKAKTGIWGLDNILSGGFSRGHLFLVEGVPGTGAHESTIREYRIDRRGLTIGSPLEAFHGILRGVPIYVGESAPLLHGQGR